MKMRQRRARWTRNNKVMQIRVPDEVAAGLLQLTTTQRAAVFAIALRAYRKLQNGKR